MKRFLRIAASLAFLILSISAIADWRDVDKKLQQSKSQDEGIALLLNSEYANDESLTTYLDSYDLASTKEEKDGAYASIKQFVGANALSETFALKPGAGATASEVKKDPMYKIQKDGSSSNWLQKLRDRFDNLSDKKSQDPINLNGITAPPLWIGFFVQGFFILFCIAIVAAIVILLINIPWSWTKAGRAKRLKRGGLLEDGEILLSEDEYLIEADRLIAEGRFRDACRALFLASLLRIDKARIARFEPAQTNWEHLRRIESSKTKPEGLEFRPITKAFDLAWYGYRVKSAEDVIIFRETYLTVKRLTEGLI